MQKNRCTLVLCSLALAACVVRPLATDTPEAAPVAPAPVSAYTMRVVIKVPITAAMNPERIARKATQLSGVSVRYLLGMGNQWHSLVLNCPDISSCSTAFDRLENNAGVFDSVQRDSWRKPLSN